MRDDKWLFEKLDEIWDKNFPDVAQDNDVRIVWGRRARNRLGSIKQIPHFKNQISNKLQKSKNQKPFSDCHGITVITINALFKDKTIPDYVVCSTIAHELTHYAHGFHSPLEQKYKTPHAGGIIDKEMDERGLEKDRKKAKKWLKENWQNYLIKNFPPSPNQRKRRRVIIKWM